MEIALSVTLDLYGKLDPPPLQIAMSIGRRNLLECD